MSAIKNKNLKSLPQRPTVCRWRWAVAHSADDLQRLLGNLRSLSSQRLEWMSLARRLLETRDLTDSESDIKACRSEVPQLLYASLEAEVLMLKNS